MTRPADSGSVTPASRERAGASPPVPEGRLRVYDICKVIDLLTNEGSVVELRRDCGVGIVIAFARIAGRAVALMVNDPKWLGAAINSEAADEAAHFV